MEESIIDSSQQNGQKTIAKSQRELSHLSVDKSAHWLTYGQDEGQHCFYGAYGHIRKQLDYDYHTYYRKERQWLHDSIIEDFLRNGSYNNPHRKPVNPWFILTVGCQGAGKRHVIDQLVEEEKLPLVSFACVDAGELRCFVSQGLFTGIALTFDL